MMQFLYNLVFCHLSRQQKAHLSVVCMARAMKRGASSVLLMLLTLPLFNRWLQADDFSSYLKIDCRNHLASNCSAPFLLLWSSLWNKKNKNILWKFLSINLLLSQMHNRDRELMQKIGHTMFHGRDDDILFCADCLSSRVLYFVVCRSGE